MIYYVKILREDGEFVASFPDLPNVNTFGTSMDEALQNASDALNGCIESDFERGFKIPIAKVYKGKCFFPIKLKPHIKLSMQLRELRAKKNSN